MPGLLISIVRTVVPMAWGAVVGWLLARGWITEDIAATMHEWVVPMVAALVLLVGALWYSLARWAEPRLSGWLRRVLPDAAADLVATWLRRALFGSATPPTYLTASTLAEHIATTVRQQQRSTAPGRNPYGPGRIQ